MQLTRVLGFCLPESCSFVLKSLQYHYWCPRGQILSINLHKMAALVKHQGWVTSEGRGSGEVMAGSGSLAPVVPEPEPEDAALARAWSQRPGSASGATTEAQLGRTPGLDQ